MLTSNRSGRATVLPSNTASTNVGKKKRNVIFKAFQNYRQGKMPSNEAIVKWIDKLLSMSFFKESSKSGLSPEMKTWLVETETTLKLFKTWILTENRDGILQRFLYHLNLTGRTGGAELARMRSGSTGGKLLLSHNSKTHQDLYAVFDEGHERQSTQNIIENITNKMRTSPEARKLMAVLNMILFRPDMRKAIGQLIGWMQKVMQIRIESINSEPVEDSIEFRNILSSPTVVPTTTTKEMPVPMVQRESTRSQNIADELQRVRQNLSNAEMELSQLERGIPIGSLYGEQRQGEEEVNVPPERFNAAKNISSPNYVFGNPRQSSAVLEERANPSFTSSKFYSQEGTPQQSSVRLASTLETSENTLKPVNVHFVEERPTKTEVDVESLRRLPIVEVEAPVIQQKDTRPLFPSSRFQRNNGPVSLKSRDLLNELAEILYVLSKTPELSDFTSNFKSIKQYFWMNAPRKGLGGYHDANALAAANDLGILISRLARVDQGTFSSVAQSFKEIKDMNSRDFAFKDFSNDFAGFLQDCIADTSYIRTDEYFDRGNYLLCRIDDMSTAEKYSQVYAKILSESSHLFEGLTTNPFLSQFTSKTKNLTLLNFFGVASAMTPLNWIHPGFADDLRKVIIPQIIRKFQMITLPKLESTGPEYDLDLDNIVINIERFTPTLVKLKNSVKLTSEPKVRLFGRSRGNLTFLKKRERKKTLSQEGFLNSLHLKLMSESVGINDVKFYYWKKKGIFGDSHDSGLVDMNIYGRGMQIDLQLNSRTAEEMKRGLGTFYAKKIFVKIHKLKVNFHNTTHRNRYRFLGFLINMRIKKMLQTNIRNYIQNMITILDKRVTFLAKGLSKYESNMKAFESQTNP